MKESVETNDLIVLPQNWQCSVMVGQTILEAALVAGIKLPSSCRNGTCRACMCKLLAGEIRYRIEWPGLSFEEKAEAWILPCVAEVRGAVIIHAPLALKVQDVD